MSILRLGDEGLQIPSWWPQLFAACLPGSLVEAGDHVVSQPLQEAQVSKIES